MIKAATATDASAGTAGTRTAVAHAVEAASGRFDGVAAQIDAASAADIIAALPFAIIAAVAENATASDSAASYIGVVNLAGESLNAVAVQDATSISL